MTTKKTTKKEELLGAIKKTVKIEPLKFMFAQGPKENIDNKLVTKSVILEMQWQINIKDMEELAKLFGGERVKVTFEEDEE